MNFFEAIKSGFKNYVNFSGRAQRSAYWYWILFFYIALFTPIFIDLALSAGSSEPTGISAVAFVVVLVCFLPNLAIGVRRLHDMDNSGWWILLTLLGGLGQIILFIWFCIKGTEGPNRFGPDPLASGSDIAKTFT
jgi:uncharacterized membrane protein YhaH (DUF805 family)